MQVVSIKTRVESVYGFSYCNQNVDETLSSFAFRFYLRHYTGAGEVLVPAAVAGGYMNVDLRNGVAVEAAKAAQA